ncbi:DMT family transporter [Sessilibacter sp. MAH2]
MKVILCYILVVLIWSTTPLAIHISSGDVGFMLAVTLRMTFGAALVWLVLLYVKKTFTLNRQTIITFCAASFGVFPNMPLVYWAAEKIPTGVVSLLFSTSPFIVGLFSKIILSESIGLERLLGMIIAFLGMALVFSDQIQIGPDALLGILAMIASTSIFSISAVMMKKLGTNTDPLQQSCGSMLFALPGLWITWLMIDGSVPTHVEWVSISALAYLVVIGSLIGFSAYYYLLKNLSANTVSLTAMISPIFAMILGTAFNDEQFNPLLLIGAAVLLIGLGVYLGLFRKLLQRTPALQKAE